MTPPINVPKEWIEGEETKFWQKVKKTDFCWLWTGAINQNGYGRFYSGKGTFVHRYSYELHKGKIPEGLVIDHLCRVRNCVNPDHLEAVTFKENRSRGIGRGANRVKKTHCKKGHEFTEENTGYRFRRNGLDRWCRTCRREIYYRKKELRIKSAESFLKKI